MRLRGQLVRWGGHREGTGWKNGAEFIKKKKKEERKNPLF